MRSLLRDLRSALTMLMMNPGFAVAALITLTVGLVIKASVVSLFADCIFERLVH